MGLSRKHYFQSNFMELQLAQAIDILRRTPSVLNALLLHLPGGWSKLNEGPESWSPFDVLGHLIHGEETDWIPRARIILVDGESRPFAPFDRFAQLEKSAGETLDELLATFARMRGQSLEQLEQWKLTDEELEKKGVHPEFGEVTLRQLLATWVVHDLSHLAQISRVMCKQYGEAVGPWKAYLPILSR